MKAFLKKHLSLILFVMFTLALFALVFYLFNFSWTIFLFPFFLVLILLFMFLLIQWFNFKREIGYQQKYRILLHESQVEKNNLLTKEKDREDYFLLWVHQIKTPIAAIKMLLEKKDHPLNGLLNQELVKIDAYSNLALNYLKVTNPKRDMLFSWICLNDLIQPLLKRYRHQFIHQVITLHYQPINQEVLTEANLSQIMIEQILSNALKYSTYGNIWITWIAERQELEIRDDGRGINAQDIPKIFNKGYSGHNGLLNEQSSGIGLYMVHLISERLSQPIEVKSQKGIGTTFSIQFNQEIN